MQICLSNCLFRLCSHAPDEMRIISLGTAMPFQRPAQAAPSFLVELGNGDKFLFDIGTGSAERLAALQIPYDYLQKEKKWRHPSF